MKKTIVTIGLILTSIVITQSCKKDKTDTDADNALYSEITTDGYTYYQSGNLLSGVSPSSRGSFKLRFNAAALAAQGSCQWEVVFQQVQSL
ncbi:MAG TPA: hypothetical protein PKN75_12045 [Bacteroidia bacterium]|nr:hypothetical protein [Bacteroidia bacterium]HNU34308.1 hypothetical protein [Bacteroidia bacterium]